MLDVKQIKAVGFDVDGTLYHSTAELQMAVGQDIVVEAARRLGQDSDELAEEYLIRRERFRSNTMTLNSFGLPGEEIFQKIWNEVPLQKYVKKDVRLAKLMKMLAKKYLLFIISNGRAVEIKKKLHYLGVEDSLFDPLIACYDHNWVKPEPAPFLLAIESLKLEPENMVYVGDREDLDIEGASSNGMQTIYVGGVSQIATASIESVYDIVSVL